MGTTQKTVTMDICDFCGKEAPIVTQVSFTASVDRGEGRPREDFNVQGDMCGPCEERPLKAHREDARKQMLEQANGGG